MKNTFLKNVFRDIKSTKGKIFAIFSMVGLASAVIVGLWLTGVSMREILDKSLKEYDFPDLKVTSTYGLDEDDRKIFEGKPGVEKISLVKIKDVDLDGKVLRLFSKEKDLNELVITEGRDVKGPDEIVLDEGLKSSYKLGARVKLKSLSDGDLKEDLENTSFKVVGFGKSSRKFFDNLQETSYEGKKSVDNFAYLDEKNFKAKKYGLASLSFKRPSDREEADLKFTSDRYLTFSEGLKADTEKALEDRPLDLLLETRQDAKEEISQKEREIEEGEKKLAEGEDKLKSSKKDLDQGERDLEKAKKDYQEKISKAEADLGTAKERLDQGQASLDQGKKTYESSLATYNNKIASGEKELFDKEALLKDKKKDLDLAREDYKKKSSELEDSFAPFFKEVEEAEKSLDALSQNLEGLKVQRDDLSSKINLLKESGEDTSDLEEKLANLDSQIGALGQKYEAGRTSLAEKSAQLNGQYQEKEGQLSAYKEKLDSAQGQYDQGVKELEVGKKKFEEEKSKGGTELSKAKTDLDKNERLLQASRADYQKGVETFNQEKTEGEKKLRAAEEKISSGKKEFQEGQKKFDQESPGSKKDLEEGREKLQKAKSDLLRIKMPEYTVSFIKDDVMINTYYENSYRMDNLSKVFPTFFYLVAMLVTLTTMKRYIQEQTVEIGTFKALGMGRGDIFKKYLLYGLFPTFIGAIIGGLLGKKILTRVIINAYSSGYNILESEPVRAGSLILLSIILGLVLIGLTIYFSVRSIIKETPANLLIGKGPTKGSKIFFERLGPLWRRLSFYWKVTFRNLFRYKERMFMTIFGVGGCTALIFFGFSMFDCIKDTNYYQNKEINHYQSLLVFNPGADKESKEELGEKISENENIPILYQLTSIDNKGMKEDLSLILPSDKEKIQDFISLRTHKGEGIALSDEGVVISDGLAKLTGKGVGDKLTYLDDSGVRRSFKVSQVTENYVGNRIFISPNYYREVFKKEPNYNAYLVKGNSQETIEKIKDNSAVLSTVQTDLTSSYMEKLLGNLSLVIAAITVLSVVLAVVVLNNLNSINVSERKKELSTLKVLGFYPRELTSYIYRESVLLTVSGILIGYLLGYWMFRYIVAVVPPRQIMLSYTVHPKSFIIAGGMNFLISLITQGIVHGKLRNIDMAEAMKSID